jgi:DNA end-binding protein Ku
MAARQFIFASLRARINPRSAIHRHQGQHIAFHLLHDRCGSRVQNRYHCPVCNVTVEREDRVRVYEFTKDQYVQLAEAELESLETESSNNIELKEFIPLAKIDPVYFDGAF